MNEAHLLARLAAPGAILARLRVGGDFGVFPKGDRRRRPVARADAERVRALASEGVVREVGADVFALSAAGASRLRRENAGSEEAFIAQHAPLVTRSVVGADGDLHDVRALDGSVVMRRLGAMQDVKGAPWLSDAELRAAAQLRGDWEVAQRGLVRGSDWHAPPKTGGARGVSNAVEDAMVRYGEARRRVAEALDMLALPLRRAVERVCLHEDGLDALERAEGWPARSGKLALKMALAQLATR